MSIKPTWKTGLSALLAFQVLVAFSLAIFAIVDFPGLLKQFGVQHQPDMGILRLIMVYNLFLSMSICIWSLAWIRNDNRAGLQAGTTVGFLILVVSVIVFVQYDRVDMLVFDSLRALLMVIFGGLALRDSPKQQSASGRG